MRVQLIHAPTYVNVDALSNNRPSLPLGLAYVAAALREAGHDVTVLDAIGLAPTKLTPAKPLPVLGLTAQDLAERLDPDARVVGITNMFTFAWPLVREVVRTVKTAYPDKIVIAGGENVTGMAEHCLETAPIDFIVAGEGETSTVALLEAVERGEQDFAKVEGLVFRKDGRLVRTATRARIRDLDSIPWPAWDLLDLDTYYGHRLIWGVDAGFTVPVLATRGCPYACTFCSSAMMWRRRWYSRNPERLVAEIEYLMETYGATNFPFQDLTAILRRDWIVAFCRELIRRGLKIRWQMPAGTRCEAIDSEVARLMRKSGVLNIAFAPESGSARMREQMGKHMSEEALMQAVKASVRNGVPITAFMMVGQPDETWQDIRESIRLCRKLAIAGIDDIGPGYFFPVPGTPLFDSLMAEGRIQLNDDFFATSIYATNLRLAEENNFSKRLSAKQLTLAKVLLILNFYLLSYALRPWRLIRVLWHGLRGVETSKLEGYLVTLRGRAVAAVRRCLGLSGRKERQTPETHSGEQPD